MEAYHVFIQAGVIVQGLLQYLSATFPTLVRSSFGSWLRAIRAGIAPSEFVVAEPSGKASAICGCPALPPEMNSPLLRTTAIEKKTMPRLANHFTLRCAPHRPVLAALFLVAMVQPALSQATPAYAETVEWFQTSMNAYVESDGKINFAIVDCTIIERYDYVSRNTGKWSTGFVLRADLHRGRVVGARYQGDRFLVIAAENTRFPRHELSSESDPDTSATSSEDNLFARFNSPDHAQRIRNALAHLQTFCPPPKEPF